jgi:hypothetical protein
MIRARNLWLLLLLMGWIAGFEGAAQAQLEATLTFNGSQTVAAGQGVADAGAFSLANHSGEPVTIQAVRLVVQGPQLFSLINLEGVVNATHELVRVAKPTFSNTFSFTTLPPIPAGGSATFTLSAVMATASARRGNRRNFAYAAILPPLIGQGFWGAQGWCLSALVLLLAGGRMRRRHLIALTLALTTAAVVAGCGGGGGDGGIPISLGQSSQIVYSISPSPTTTTGGLPLPLGTLKVL